MERLLKENNKSIEIEDVVEVNINCALLTLSHKAKVLSMPVATGDSWVFECLETGKIIAVSEGCTVTKEKQES